MLKLNIMLFGGRGASSSNTGNVLDINNLSLKIEHIPTFKGNENFQKALSNGYRIYLGDDLELAGSNYERIATKLKSEGYKVRVYEDTTRVRGVHSYRVMYKRK